MAQISEGISDLHSPGHKVKAKRATAISKFKDKRRDGGSFSVLHSEDR